MVDFADRISDRATAERLHRALQGKGAFRRFRDRLYDSAPELISVWNELRNARSERRAVQWLLDEGLIEESSAERFFEEHPDPELP